MKNTITVVYAFRDREVSRLLNSVQSVRKHSKEQMINFTVVDYGSSPLYRDALASACANADIHLIRTETEGQPWSKAIAMNIGISSATTDVFLSTDIDMIFEFDVVSELNSRLTKNTKVHCRPYWLPPSGDLRQATLGNFDQLGGFMAMYVEDFMRIGGFCEHIEFWGFEDTEFHSRALGSGCTDVWMPQEIRMYHVWHLPSYGFWDIRPQSSLVFDQTSLVRAFLTNTKAKNEDSHRIGECRSLEDRPLLRMIRENKLQPDAVLEGLYSRELIQQLVELLVQGNIVYLKSGLLFGGFFGGIKEKNKGSIVRHIAKVNSLLSRLGLEIRLARNTKHDWIHILIHELQPIIRDYYWDFENGCYFYPRFKLS